MTTEDPVARWRVRFDQYRSALSLFREVERSRGERPLNDAEKAGLVQFFALTVELGWKTLGTLLRHQGVDVSMAPMPVLRAAFAAGLIEDGDVWARAIEDRNRFAHVYDARAFDALAARAGSEYLAMLDALAERLGRDAA